MDCPVCLAQVRDLTPGNYRGLVVECPRCGVYRVMPAALSGLRQLKTEKRLAALRRAKEFTWSRAWPTISKACFLISQEGVSSGTVEPCLVRGLAGSEVSPFERRRGMRLSSKQKGKKHTYLPTHPR